MDTLRIVEPVVDADTVRSLQKLLEAALRGRIVGLAYVALHCGPDYSADVVGEAKAHPLLTRGIVGALEDAVAAHPRRK